MIKNNSNNNNNTPYLRKKISPTLLTISAIALLLSSPLVISNLLLQPVQAQTTFTFKTPTPAGGSDPCVARSGSSMNTMTFDANGTASSDPQKGIITSGTFNVTTTDSSNSYSGKITQGVFKNNSNGVSLLLTGTVEQVSFPASSCGMIQGSQYLIHTQCSTSNTAVSIYPSYETQSGTPNFLGTFQGVVECSLPSLGGDSTQPSSSASTTGTTTTTQDSDGDGDGIPDSSDSCAHNSNPRCFKDDTTTTTQQQQPSSNRTGNQTR